MPIQFNQYKSQSKVFQGPSGLPRIYNPENTIMDGFQEIVGVIRPQSKTFASFESGIEYSHESYDNTFKKEVTDQVGRCVYLMYSEIESKDHIFAVKIGSSQEPKIRLENVKGFTAKGDMRITVGAPDLVGHTARFAAGEEIEKRAQQIYRDACKVNYGYDPIISNKKDWFICQDLMGPYFSILAAVSEMSQLDKSFVSPNALLWFVDCTTNKFISSQAAQNSKSEYTRTFDFEAVQRGWNEGRWFYGLVASVYQDLPTPTNEYLYMKMSSATESSPMDEDFSSISAKVKPSIYRIHAHGFRNGVDEYLSYYYRIAKTVTSLRMKEGMIELLKEELNISKRRGFQQ
tara:strand:+ start:70 stop:1107 length:1038 start_codon:yes stop_codon:yes gene_type:complete